MVHELHPAAASGGEPGSTLPEFVARLPELAAEIAREAGRRDRERELPHEAFARIKAARLGALRIPAALGGPGASVAQLMDLLAQLAAGDPNVAHALRSHFNFVEGLLLAPEARQAAYAPLVLRGVLFGGAHTELGTARPGEIRTTLTRRKDGYRLDGRKYYSTGALFADRIFITASDETGRPATVELEPTRPGVAILDDWDGMGQRLTASGSIVLDNVAVSEEEISWRETTEAIDFAGRHAATFRQLYLAACQAGVVRNVLSDAVAFVNQRARPITHGHADSSAEDMFVQRTVGLISARSFAIDAILAAAAQQIDLARHAIGVGSSDVDQLLTNSALATAKAQTVIAELGLAAATSIFDAGGGSATSRTLNFDRHWRNIRTILGHNPIDYKNKVVGAHALTGAPLPLSGGFF